MSLKSNQKPRGNSVVPLKKGRPPRDPILKFRTLFWYWSVRGKSGLKDGDLDREFSNAEEDGKKRDYADRVRIFEDIRKSGCTISKGNHKRRKFDLIERVNAHPELAGSADVYNSPFWKILSNKNPTYEQTVEDLLGMIKFCKLNDVGFVDCLDPTQEELEKLSKRTGRSINEIKKIFEVDSNSKKRKEFDIVLSNFTSIGNFKGLMNDVNFSLLTNHLNKMAFYIAFYRHAMFTGNFHAMVSAADFILEHLSLFISDIKWPDQKFRREFLHVINSRVLEVGGANKMEDIIHNPKYAEIGNVKEGSALYELFKLLGQ